MHVLIVDERCGRRWGIAVVERRIGRNIRGLDPWRERRQRRTVVGVRAQVLRV